MISFPAPAMCQMSGEVLLLAIGEVVYPGLAKRHPKENGFRLWVEGDPKDPRAQKLATDRFQVLLGVLRVLRDDVGELKEERLVGAGAGSVRDEAGNQYVRVGTVIAPAIFPGRVDAFAAETKVAIENSERLRAALQLNGRSGRTPSTFFAILEYAQREFGGDKGVRDALGVSTTSQGKLMQSASNLSPLDGGRHAAEKGSVPWTLDRQQAFTTDLLGRWIHHHSASAGAEAVQDSATLPLSNGAKT